MSKQIEYQTEVADEKTIQNIGLGKLIADVEELVGTNSSIVSQEELESDIDRRKIAEKEEKAAESVISKEAIVTFEGIVDRSVQKYRMDREHILRNKGIVGADIDYFADQINMRTTIWKLEEEMLKRHLENLKKCAEFKGELPDPSPSRPVDVFEAKLQSQQSKQQSRVSGREYYDWERQAKRSLLEIKQLLPVLQIVHRIVDAGQLLTRVENTTTGEGKMISDAHTELRKHLPAPGKELSGVLEGLKFDVNSSTGELERVLWELERRLRERSGEKVEMRLPGEGQGTKVEIATATYLRLLTNRRSHMIDAMAKPVRDGGPISVDQFETFVKTQKEIHDLVMDFRVNGMRRHMDRFSLLVTRDAVTPKVTGDRLQQNPQLARYLMDFYREVVVPGDIADALKGEEITRHAEGIRTYMHMVTGDMAEYKSVLVEKEADLWDKWPKEQEAIETRQGYINLTYLLPEMTVGWYRTLSGGLVDYRQLTGETQKWENLDAVNALMDMGIEAANLQTIESTHVPKLAELRNLVEVDISDVMKLLDDSDKKPENFVNLSPNAQDAVRKEYVDALVRMEEHRGQFAAELNAMYKAYDATLYEHVRRGAIHQNLTNKNLPSYGLIALGTNVGTVAYLTALWAYGGRGGVRSIPQWGRIFRPFINQPDRWYNRPLLVRGVKGAANAPGRIFNAHTRVIMDPIDFARWLLGNPRERVLHDYTPHEQVRELTRRFGREMKEMEALVKGMGEGKLAEVQALEARIAELESKIATEKAVPLARHQELQQCFDRVQQEMTSIRQETQDLSAEAQRIIAGLESEVQQVKLECYKNELRLLLQERDTALKMKGAERVAALGAARENVRNFMGRFNAFADGTGSVPGYAPARAELAEIIMGREFSADALHHAHITEDLNGKFKRLEEGIPNFNELTAPERAVLKRKWLTLARMGLIGKVKGDKSGAALETFATLGEGADQIESRMPPSVTPIDRSRYFRGILRNLDNLTPLQRAVRLGGIGFQGALFGLHALSLRNALEFQSESRTRMQEDLEKLVSDEKLSAESKDGEIVYHYPPHAEKPKFSIALQNLQEPANVGVDAQIAHTAVSGLGLLAWMRYAKGLNPAGLAILGIEITVNTGIDAWGRSADYQFIADFPPWLVLALGGTQGTVNKSEFNLIDETVSDYLITPGNLAGLFEGEKSLEVRKRLFLLSFAETLAQSDPQLFQHMQMTMGGLPGVMEYMEKEEFGSFSGDCGVGARLDGRIITNAFFSQLLVDADVANLQWDSLHRFEVDQWGVALSLVSKVSPEKFTEVFRTVIEDFFAPHMWTKLYLQAKADHDAATEPVEKAILAERMYQFGQKDLYGKRLLDIAPNLENIRDRYEGREGYSTIVTPSEVLAKRFHDTISAAVPEGEGSFSGWMNLQDKEQDAWERSAKAEELEKFHAGTNDAVGRFTDKKPHTRSRDPAADVANTIASYDRDFSIDIADRDIATLLQIEHGETDKIWFRNALMRSTRQLFIPESEPALVPLELRGEDRGNFVFDHEKARAIALAEEVRSMEKELNEKLTKIRERSTPETLQEFAELHAEYIVLLQRAEEDAKAISQYEEESRGVTDEVRNALSSGATDYELKKVRPNDVIAEKYFSGEIPPVVMTSDIVLPGDEWALNAVLSFPAMTGGPTFGPDNLFSVHVQKETVKDKAGAKDRVLATFTYKLADSRPYFVQVAATRANADGEYAYRLELPRYDVTATYEERHIYDRSLEIRESQQLMRKQLVVAAMTPAELTFRAGMNPGEMRQIGENIWGVRTVDAKGGSTFTRVRFLPESGMWQKQTLDVGSPKDPSAAQWVATFEAYRQMGVKHLEPRLTEGEGGQKTFAKHLDDRLKAEGWTQVSGDDPLVAKSLSSESLPFTWAKDIPSDDQLIDEMIHRLQLDAIDPDDAALRSARKAIQEGFEIVRSDPQLNVLYIRHQYFSQIEARLQYNRPRNGQEIFDAAVESAKNVDGDNGLLYASFPH